MSNPAKLGDRSTMRKIPPHGIERIRNLTPQRLDTVSSCATWECGVVAHSALTVFRLGTHCHIRSSVHGTECLACVGRVLSAERWEACLVDWSSSAKLQVGP